MRRKQRYESTRVPFEPCNMSLGMFIYLFLCISRAKTGAIPNKLPKCTHYVLHPIIIGQHILQPPPIIMHSPWDETHFAESVLPNGMRKELAYFFPLPQRQESYCWRQGTKIHPCLHCQPQMQRGFWKERPGHL